MKLIAGALLPHPPIVIPEIGGSEAKRAQKTYEAMEAVARRIGEARPDTIIIISPHGNLFRDAICILDSDRLVGDLGEFGAEKLSFDYDLDRELLELIRVETRDFPVLFLDKEASRSLGSLSLDHGAMVPLYFLEKHLEIKPKLLHINYGFLSAQELGHFGGLVGRAIERQGRKVLVIASGDLSHRLKLEASYDFHEDGQIFDREVGRLIEEGRLEGFFNLDETMVENAGECALRSLQILSGILRGLPIKSELLAYGAPWSVGYMSAYLEVEEEKDPVLILARSALEELIKKGRDLELGDSFPELRAREGACFVSLHKFGQLRGCIGSLEPARNNLAEEIIANTRSAALEDPRFPRVEEDELGDLAIGVDILGPIEACAYEELDPVNYGVIVKSGGRKGLLLPDLAGVDTVERQVEIARNKAGIGEFEALDYYRFRVSRHGN